MITVYDFDTDPNRNVSQPPDGFPEGFFDSDDFNLVMRTIMATIKRDWLDRVAASAASTPNADGFGLDLNLTLNQSDIVDPPPTGFIVGFKLPFTPTSPLYASIDNTTFRQIRCARGSALGPGSLTVNGIYQMVFDGMEWQLLGNLKGTGRQFARTLRAVDVTVGPPTTTPLRSTDIGNSVAVYADDVANPTETILELSEATLLRWPIGADIELIGDRFISTIALSMPSESYVVENAATYDDNRSDLTGFWNTRLDISTGSSTIKRGKLLRKSNLTFSLERP